MNLAEISFQRQKLTHFFVVLLILAGGFAYTQLGRLEDPNFTVKTAVIVTSYPGASPEEVEQEVTDKIEVALQKLTQLDNMYSLSKAGMSIIKVDINQEYWADRLPQVWDQMRKRIRDIQGELPIGVTPNIVDDFSFVYGFVLAITGDGYDYAELEDYAKFIKKDLGLVEGVSRAEIWGVQPRVVYLDVSTAKMAQLGVTREELIATLSSQNFVVDAGSVNQAGRRMRMEVSGEFNSAEDIGDVLIQRTKRDDETLQSLPTGLSLAQQANALIRIQDIASVRIGHLEPAMKMMRFNGKPALALSLANEDGGNVPATGAAIDKRLNELKVQLPAGIHVDKFQWQSELVNKAIGDFVISLAEAVAIVLIVLWLAMGWRMGVVIGAGLVLTILGTFILMLMMKIELHRVSLGALVIALGMMVDNSIVVADGYVSRLQKGLSPRDAATQSANIPAWPLLGATVIACMAFFPIFFSKVDGGEYARTLFIVVATSLMLSWFIAVFVTPMQCVALIKPCSGEGSGDLYSGGFYGRFRQLLGSCLRHRTAFLLGSVAVLAVSTWGFKFVSQQFFPDSTRTQFVIDYWAPEGTPIESVADSLVAIEEKLTADPRVAAVGSFIGEGGPRFYLPVDPEFPYASYAQLVVNTDTFDNVDPLVREIEPWLNQNYPHILTRVRKYTVGPGDTWQFELRITGPGDADTVTLRRLAAEVMAILKASPLAKHVRTDMRNQVQKLAMDYSQKRARWTGVSRTDIADATRLAHDGTPVGLYRQGDDVYPIVARLERDDRQRTVSELDLVPVSPTLSSSTLPLAAVTSEIALEWEDPIIARWNRRREIAVQAMPDGVTFPALYDDVIDEISDWEASLPPGYEIFWDGEYKSAKEGDEALIPGIPPAIVTVLFIIIALFNSYRAPLIMLTAIPFVMIGITSVMLLADLSFGFMAQLGALSLFGMMIKNSIVLLDEVNLNLEQGLSRYDAVVEAAVSRLRPVILAAATTILGVIPLLSDAFWVSMSATIMAGLAIGTLCTMVLVPVLYALLYRVDVPRVSYIRSER